MGRLNKRKQQLKRLAEASQARHDNDESGREEEEVTMFGGETTVDVDIDALGEDAVWQEEELEFEDVEKLNEDERCFFRDEDVREKIDTYLREKKFEVRIHTLTKYINEEVLPDLDDGLSVKLSERIVIQWMKIFEHSYREATKGMYMDGHEQDDVIAYHGPFLAKMVEHEKQMSMFTDDCLDVIWPNLQNGEKPLIFVKHDESIFHAFDGQGRQWLPTGE